MNPVKLQITRKTRVPTKKAIIHDFRTDWLPIVKINYADSYKMFKNIGNGPIETDAQFCYWLYKNFGEGTYLCVAWTKGYRGFWNFGMYELSQFGFKRLRKNITKKQREKMEMKQELKDLNKQMIVVPSHEEKSDIQEEIEMVKEIYKEPENERGKRRGPVPWLKQTQPVYKLHRYEGIKNHAIQEEEAKSFW